jgi:hunchback-like protein
MASFEPDQANKWPHDQLTRHLAARTSLPIDQNGQSPLTTSFHTNGNNFPPYSSANGYPPSSEFDTEDKKPPIIDWNEKIWQQNGTSKLSPSDVVRTATPSANSTESTPSSQRHSIGPEEGEHRGTTPEIKSEFSEASPEESNVRNVEATTNDKEKDETNPLLSLAQPTSAAAVPASDQNELAALRIEEKILHEKLTPHIEPQMTEKKAESIQSVVNSVSNAQFDVDQLTPQTVLPQKSIPNPIPLQAPASTTPPRNSRAFFRAPGHGGPPESQDNSKAFVCAICNFSCPSKFHYNSHMNTHGDHQCSMCDYTSRTEGRLKKHMRECHTREEQTAAGLDVSPETPAAVPNTAEFQATMASLMQAAKTAVNNAAAVASANANNNNAESGNNSPISTIPSALDSLRALSQGEQTTNLEHLLRDASTDSVDAAGPSTPREPPKRSSGGKAKQYACKQCAYVATSKEDSWRHSRSHIPSDKQLSCPHCEFVTEYKHHLEYHMRNHFGSKPFGCTKCEYKCVNKSMLNSHMKSHSTEYQFSCIDCSYQSKYCHSLKMHLRKYNHRRRPGLNIDDAEEALANDHSLEEDGCSVHSGFSDSMHHENNGDSQHLPPLVSSAPPATADSSNNNNNIGNALLQPIATTSSLPYANLLRNQEQLNAMAARQQQQQQQAQQSFPCSVCDFSTPHIEQLLHHNMIHIQQNQTASAPSTPLNALLQYLQNNAQHQHATIPNGTASIGSLSQLSAFHPTSTEMLFRAQQIQQEQHSEQQQQHQQQSKHGESESRYNEDVKMEVDSHHQRARSPTESMNGDSSSHERSSTSPMDTKDIIVINSDAHSVGSNSSSSSSRKRKATNGSSKLEEISQRLQGKNSPEVIEDSTPQIVAPVPIPAYRQGFMEVPKIDRNPSYPNNCDHCKIGFEDATLYDLHRGYHGYDNPFKCNRCGETCASAVAFNLHLWRVKHD